MVCRKGVCGMKVYVGSGKYSVFLRLWGNGQFDFRIVTFTFVWNVETFKGNSLKETCSWRFQDRGGAWWFFRISSSRKGWHENVKHRVTSGVCVVPNQWKLSTLAGSWLVLICKCLANKRKKILWGIDSVFKILFNETIKTMKISSWHLSGLEKYTCGGGWQVQVGVLILNVIANR